MADTAKNENTFDDLVGALNRNDPAGCVELFVEDGILIDYTNPSVVHEGRAAIAEVLKGLFDELRPQFEVLVSIAQDDRLAVEYRLRADPANGSGPFDAYYSGFYEFSDGELVSEHIHYDSPQVPLGA